MTRTLWQFIGRVCYYLSWPLVYMMLRRTCRTRVLIICDGQVVVVHGWLANGKWQLPGGGRHRGESSLQAAIREVHEEVGLWLEPSQLQFLVSIPKQSGQLPFNIDMYAVEMPRKLDLTPQRGEIIDAGWLPLKNIAATNCNPDVLLARDAWIRPR
jgi:8-oxo-dGTP pyrophosphatase MutT (NUDIX family)